MRFRIMKSTMRGTVLSLALLACNSDKFLDVPDPDVATPQSVQVASALPAVLAGALSDFQVAFSGQNSGDSQASLSALFTDEFLWAETFPTRYEVDARNIQPVNATMDGVFRSLHRARASANRAADGFGRFATSDPALATPQGWAESLNLEGMAYVLFGENYCSGVPFSTLTQTGGKEFGNPLTTAQMFEAAIVRFDSALTVLGTGTSAAVVAQRNLASVGKGRALLNLNQPAQAAAAVAGVPTAFVYSVLHSENSNRQHNGVFSLVYEGRRFSVPNMEGGNGLAFRTDAAAGDPRIPNAAGTGGNQFGFDGTTQLQLQQKYPARTTGAVVAGGIEARLIEAENLMRNNDPTWILTLNTLRGTVTGLAPLVDPVTPAARQDMLFKERAYWMWLTSHRLGDLRRLVRQYGRTQDQVFPSGAYHKGGVYGTDVNFPIPFSEGNNPNFTTCIDRNA